MVEYSGSKGTCAVSNTYRSLTFIVQINECVGFNAVNINRFLYDLRSIQRVLMPSNFAGVIICDLFENSATCFVITEGNILVFAVIVRSKLTTFPSKLFGTANRRRIACGIIGDGTVSGDVCKQILPGAITISIAYRTLNRSECPGCKRICLSRQDIPGIIISIYIRFAEDLVIFAGELSQVIILILILNDTACVSNLRNITVGIVGVIVCR